MKNLLFVLAFMAAQAMAQATPIILKNALSSQTLDSSQCYLLQGCVSVPAGETLTIPEGTLILCEKGASLTIEKGGQLICQGTGLNPIVFTSDRPAPMRSPGDWVGIVLNGKAKNNVMDNGGGSLDIQRCDTWQGGGHDDNDASGTLAFVRIEFAGEEIAGNDYHAGLILNSAGSGTELSHVQVSQSLHRGIVLLGGTAKLDYIYLQDNKGSDLTIAYGYRGPVSYLFANRKDLNAYEASGSYGIEVSNNPSMPTYSPLTSPMVDHFTIVGPAECGQTADNLVKSGIKVYAHGGGSFQNGVITGYREYGIDVLDAGSEARTLDGTLWFGYCSVSNQGIAPIHQASGSWSGCGTDIHDWFWGTSPCGATNNQPPVFSTGYGTDMCNDYCSTMPTFKVNEGTELWASSEGVLERGALQVSDIFGWTSTCPGLPYKCSVESPRTISYLPLVAEAYPNPADGRVRIAFESPQTGQSLLVVHDPISGKELLRKSVPIPIKGRQEIELDLRGLPMGLYPVSVFCPDRSFRTQIMVR